MCPSPILTRVLLVLSVLPSLIIAEDVKTVVFPSHGNGSVFVHDGKIESTIPSDVTQPTVAPVLSPISSNNYFYPAPQRGFVHHRSAAFPYVYETPFVGYPVAHALDHSIGPSSKQLVIVSFIGLLLLFAIIQNTIASVKRRDALIESLDSREKRDLYATYNFNSVSPEQEDILNDDARVRCIQRTICLENKKLLHDLGAVGKILAKYLTRGVKKSVKSSPGWDRLVEDAGAAGLRGENCDVLYRDCFAPVSSKERQKNPGKDS